MVAGMTGSEDEKKKAELKIIQKRKQGLGDGLHVETGENPSGCQVSVLGQVNGQ